MNIEELALCNWPSIFEQAALPGESSDYELSVLKSISGAQTARAIIRAHSGPDVDWVYKFEPSMACASRFPEIIKAQNRAERWFQDEETLHVSKLIWSDARSGVQLFEFIPGATAKARFEWSTPDDMVRQKTLSDCGAWLRVLHRSGASELDYTAHGANWSWVANVASANAAKVRAEQLDVPAPKRFLGLCAMIHRLVRQAKGAEFKRCFLHGDPHLGNFICGSDGLYAIDLTDRGVGPVEVDVVRLMSRIRYDIGAVSTPSSFTGVAETDWTAFADGYGQDLRKSPSLPLFFALQTLSDWLRISREEVQRLPSKARRFEKIKAVFLDLREAGY